MPVLTIASAKKLAEKRIGLVLMGGGAKCAYQVGVWRALWELGIRQFATISGTSGGALNAVLIAGGPPSTARDIWNEIIAKGVLAKPANQRARLLLLLLSYLLLLSPLMTGFLLCGWFFFLGLPDDPVRIYLLCASTAVCGGAAIFISRAMRNLSTNGAVIPLFFMHWRRYHELGFALLGVGLFVFVLSAFRFGTPEQQASRIWILAILGAIPVFIALFSAGYIIIKIIFHLTSIYDRPELVSATKRILEQRDLPNCSGPVFACAGTTAAYVDPFDVPPGGETIRLNPFTGEYERLDWWKAPPQTTWVPRYVDIRTERDANWLLNATSAIPFAFPSISVSSGELGQYTHYVDGGVVDNCPILPVLFERPDLIIVVGVNYVSAPASLDDLQSHLEVLWRKWFFSQERNLKEVDAIRRTWIDKLDPIEKALDASFSGPIGRLLGWSDQIKFQTPQLSPKLHDLDFVFLQPSRHVSCPVPGLDQLTGTMRFDSMYVERLEDIGYRDTMAYFDSVKP